MHVSVCFTVRSKPFGRCYADGTQRPCILDIGHPFSCFTRVKYASFVTFNVLWRCPGQNVGCADGGFLVYFWLVQLLVCDAGQKITTFDPGRTCHTLENAQTRGKVQRPALKSEACTGLAFERVFRIQVRMRLPIPVKTPNGPEACT
jgi:hypothetical protein